MWGFDIFISTESSEEGFVNLKVNFIFVIHFDEHQLIVLFHEMIVVVSRVYRVLTHQRLLQLFVENLIVGHLRQETHDFSHQLRHAVI